ncbi:MAG: DUF4038 domain-containing protein [Kiritimatiellae bacterium]|nr:DUF4038 domain-containing protein [Kiritimatiellia bacterium]
MTEKRDAVALWGRWEGAFEAEGEPPPGTEIRVQVASPSGRQRTIPGFWDGGSVWRVRVMPDEEGEWQYTTEATGEYPGLHGRAGTFTCARRRSRNRFLRHGAVCVSGDGHYFAHADGTPFFYLGDTVWNGALLSRKADWAVFLRDRAAKRFTGIQFVTHAPWVATYSNREGELAYTNLPWFPVNPHFFRRIDDRIDAINDRGLLALPVMLWAAPFGDATKWNPGAWMPEDPLIKIARYQYARYQAHHVFWILMGDGRYEGEVAELWKRIGRAVFAGNERAPVTIHPCGRNWPYEAFRGEDWMTVIGYQSGHGDSPGQARWINEGPATREWRLEPARPIVDLEPCYEDHIAGHSKMKWDAYRVRRNCYWSMLNAPPAGLTYGAHGIWSWQEKELPPLNHPRTGPAKPWHQAKDLPGSVGMQHMAECFGLLRWWELRPDPGLLAAQPFPDDELKFVSAVRTEDGTQAMVYIPVGCEIRLNAGKRRDGARARWFDPRTGEQSDAQPAEGGVYRTPDDRDWVLLLQNGRISTCR